MPILLNTPWNPGNYDPGNTYPRAKILSFLHNTEAKTMRVVMDFGDIVEGAWVSGVPTSVSRSRPIGYVIRGEDYDAMMLEVPESGESVYDAVKRLLYAHLISKVPELAGTVE